MAANHPLLLKISSISPQTGQHPLSPPLTTSPTKTGSISGPTGGGGARAGLWRRRRRPRAERRGLAIARRRAGAGLARAAAGAAARRRQGGDAQRAQPGRSGGSASRRGGAEAGRRTRSGPSQRRSGGTRVEQWRAGDGGGPVGLGSKTFRPRILIDVSRINMATNVLGFNISMPIMIAPSAMQKMAHPEGELATARAAAPAGTIMALSSWSTSSVEEVNSVGPGIRFFQLYVYKDRNIVRQLVKRAEMAGFKAIALTVDTPRLGRREADIKNRFTLPPHLVLKNFEALDLGKIDRTKDPGLTSYVASQTDGSFSWKDIKWLQTITSLPILVKGVMTAEDTRLAIECGADGIIVSNHGARQLDYVPATISCLEEVVREAKGRIPVFLDGGVRPDVFKALALGASGVFIGRPVLFSLAVDGEAGVRKVLQMLRDELELTMALSGCTSLKEITRNHVITESDRIRRSRL